MSMIFGPTTPSELVLYLVLLVFWFFVIGQVRHYVWWFLRKKRFLRKSPVFGSVTRSSRHDKRRDG
jgi:type II secretory pathway component PulF